MTRLTRDDIVRLPELLPEVERGFLLSTGAGLAELAWQGAVGPSRVYLEVASEHSMGSVFPQPSPAWADLATVRVAVVPVSAGQGFISGFPEAVAAVSRFVGCEAFITEKADVAGLAAAAERQARLVLLADDERFICLDLRSGGFADNGEATGRGYAAALAAAARHRNAGAAAREQPKPAGGLDAEHTVLVLGLGAVGRAAASWLRAAGFRVLAHDPKVEWAHQAAAQLGLTLVASLHEGFAQAGLIVDACPAGGLVGPTLLTEQTIVAAPGMPSALTSAAEERLGERFLHEPLALGVATMIRMALLREAAKKL